jgi:hypothetical protein
VIKMYDKKYDLIVVGSGPGGFPAAIAAARMGLKVLLVERSAQIGGNLVTGLPLLAFLDRSGNAVVKGIAQEIIDRVKEVGGANDHIRSPLLNSMTHVNGSWMRIILFEMCEEEENLDVILYSELKSVKVDNGRVKEITIFCRGEELKFECDRLVDATGDACAAYMAGAEYEKSEKLQPPTITFELANIDYDELFAYLREHPEAYTLPETFHGVQQTMDFFVNNKCFSIMGFRDIVKMGRKSGEFNVQRNMIDFCKQPNGNAFVNISRAINTDVTDIESTVKAEFTCHRQVKEIVLFMKKYIPGFKNCDLVSMAPWLGVRESRRIAGKKRVTLDDVKNLRIPEDTVAMAGYNIDIHSPDSENMTMLAVEHAIGIPYGCLVPVRIEGMLVSGRAISVDADVFPMTRIMPTCMAVGQAAGTAMALAYKHDIQPSEIDVQELRSELKKAGAIVEL